MKQFALVKVEMVNRKPVCAVLKLLLGNSCKIYDCADILVIEHQPHSKQEIFDTIASLQADLNMNVSVYVSYANNYAETEKDLVLNSFIISDYGFYDLKKLLLAVNPSNKNDFLKFILDDCRIDFETIKALADNNLNVSKASDSLSMHRNTLIYKIRCLKEKKDFDLTDFWDLYILTKLMI